MSNDTPSATPKENALNLANKQIYSLGLLISLEYLDQIKIADTQLFADTQLSRELIQMPGALITFWQEQQFTKNAIKLANDKKLGLKIWQDYHINALNILGVGTGSASSLKEGLEFFIKYQRLSHTCAEFSVREANKSIYLTIRSHGESQEIHRHLQERDILVAVMDLPYLAGKNDIVSHVELDYPAPDYADFYNQQFQCPCYFDCEQTAIVFQKKKLLAPLPQSNPAVHKNSQILCDEQLKQLLPTNDIVMTVKSLLEGNQQKTRSLQSIAALLHTTTRTLHRRLKKQGSSYQILARECRLNKAKALILKGGATQEEMAKFLGFSDAANFSNAFKRWTGLTPRQFQKETPKN